MTATGVGDCDLHVFDQHGKAAIIRLKAVLYVPGAAKNLLSTYCIGQQEYQFVCEAKNPQFPPGLHFPKSSPNHTRYVPIHQVQNLSYIATRNDLHDSGGRMLTRANKYAVWHRKLGYMPMAALRKTKQYVTGLEDLTDSHFPGLDYSDPAVKLGKLHHADQPGLSAHRPARALELISWDTLGPMQSKSHLGYSYATIFTCAYSGYAWVYGHTSTADVPLLLEKFFAYSSVLRDKHGPILRVRRDNASVNVSNRVSDFLTTHGIRSETSNPYEPWQNGQAERMIQTLCGTARTVLAASGLDGHFWYLALQYACRVHNLQYSARFDSSPFFLMCGVKPDVSQDQAFGIEAWIHLRPDQRRDPKFGARGEPCIFVGYPTNQAGHLVWCPSRGPNVIVSSSNLIFGTRFPHAKVPAPNLLPDLVQEVFLPTTPTAFTLEEVTQTPDVRFLGSVHDQLILVSSHWDHPKVLPVAQVMDLLHLTMDQGLSSAHLNLVESYALLGMDATPGPTQRPIPRNPQEAQSSSFASEWEPAMDRELKGFLHHQCFVPVPRTPEIRVLPGSWLFSRKRDGSAKARFVIGGHRQRLGIEYFEFQNYCAVLASRDNRVLLSLAAGKGWKVSQTDIEQAFLHGVLNDVDIYVQPPARYPCPPGHVLKLLKAVYGLHQAPPKFKKEVTDWMRTNACE